MQIQVNVIAHEVSLFLRSNGDKQYGLHSEIDSPRIPCVDEFLCTLNEKEKKHFQVIAVNHVIGGELLWEVYAIETSPSWMYQEKQNIGFTFH